MRIDKSCHKDIIEMYTIDLMPLREIASIVHVSGCAVKKFLNKNGIDTSKHKIPVSCTVCSKTIYKTKKNIKKHRNHFCNMDCYNVFRDAGSGVYIQNRHAQRLARVAVSEHFRLEPLHIVHHKDFNTYNNNLNNLMVFANQGDHIKYHHYLRDIKYNANNKYRETWLRIHQKEIQVPILWDGSIK